jgi:hypothetical protein
LVSPLLCISLSLSFSLCIELKKRRKEIFHRPTQSLPFSDQRKRERGRERERERERERKGRRDINFYRGREREREREWKREREKETLYDHFPLFQSFFPPIALQSLQRTSSFNLISHSAIHLNQL